MDSSDLEIIPRYTVAKFLHAKQANMVSVMKPDIHNDKNGRMYY